MPADQSPKAGNAADPTQADALIARLGLQPHPEGGFFRETFRDPRLVSANGQSRPASTAIYFLLNAGQVSRWHTVDAVETWHFYDGAPLALDIASADGKPERHILGRDLKAGEQPQIVVPFEYWQRAQSLGSWTLVGCTVSPGFTFDGFKLAPPGFEPGM